jgi:hypothetical protein
MEGSGILHCLVLMSNVMHILVESVVRALRGTVPRALWCKPAATFFASKSKTPGTKYIPVSKKHAFFHV